MKVRIVKLSEGGESGKIDPWEGDKYSGVPNKSKYSKEEWEQIAKMLGYKGPKDNKSFQEFLATDPRTKDIIEQEHKTKGMPYAGKKVDKKLGYRWDAVGDLLVKKNEVGDPGKRTQFPDIEEGDGDGGLPEGNRYNFDDKSNTKNPYKKKNLPLYQAAPELAGFISSINTYSYQTPDYTHWEVNPTTLNIQPSLSSIDASLKAVNQSTTGNPQVDNIRRQGAFVASLNAKQQAFANKQNFDAQSRYTADSFNISARTQEQNLDVAATNTIYNEYMPLAKDYATGERIAAMSSLAKKTALNKKNENEKGLYLDNFYPNVEYDENGNMIIKGDGDFDKKYYATTEENPYAVDTPQNIIRPSSSTKLTPSSVPKIKTIEDTTTPLKPVNIPIGKLNKPVSPVVIPEEEFDPYGDPVRNQMINIKKYKKGGLYC